ncbi:FAD-binding protein [Nocardia sp. CDC159]|uniref:FAD-binding protein n=1 Tax=Nocardia pulmonis TaxID=2951408 RepID=A0A9X2E0D8_9NOCA|nr:MULTISPECIES: FAD-binding protein [Nocardia]MCM6771867.1 FAD-binding protein [Nocardia pulmonis]MCM6785475.1 FAD-binding protein [Nocardia sp. CDC159]
MTGTLDRTAITPDDPRYAEVTTAANGRFRCTPRLVHVPGTAAEVVAAVQAAADTRARLAIRSGGHCLEDFVDSAETEVLLDLSRLNRVDYDPRMGAFAIEPGALLGDVYRGLLKGWGVAIPAGLEYSVAAGGHILGGGYGPLTRAHGCVVDHLYAVEVVTVDAAGRARIVVATRDPGDPNHDLWWAHTGCGGGNFGVVTKYWMRSPNAAGDDPAQLLPRPPAEVLDGLTFWSWSDLTPESFRRLLANHGRWHERHSAPGIAENALFSILTVLRAQTDTIALLTQVDADADGAAEMLSDYLDALNDGVGVEYRHDVQRRPWLRSMLWPRLRGDVYGQRAKCKAAYLRRRYTDEQIDVIHRHLTDDAYDNPGAGVILAAYGGQASAVAPDATATAQRDSVLKAFYLNNWTDPDRDDEHIAWIRSFYRDLYAGSGGVPDLNGQADGSYINYPDTDLADPHWNSSGLAWHDLYYKGNYPRLQRIKAAYDPTGFFTHALGITA